MNKICVFAGTSEGRELVEYLSNFDATIVACVATEYGEILIENEKIKVCTGRMDESQMTEFFTSEKFDLIVDATHPYAEIVTENIFKACKKTSTEYLRINRETFFEDDCDIVENIEQAISFLSTTNGNILSTIGSKELEKFKNCDFLDRFFVRVLPFEASLKLCENANILPSHIIAMQGPFDYELNKAMLNSLKIDVLITKDTGINGGFYEKISAARALNIKTVIIKKPEQKNGFSIADAKKIITNKFGFKPQRTIYAVACGVGCENLLTNEAKKTLEKCNVIIGARRLTDKLKLSNKIVENEIYSEKIAKIIKKYPEISNIAVVFSGDIGFYSGAKKFFETLSEEKIVPICGISSPIYLCSKIKTTWQDAKLISLHGKNDDFIAKIRDNYKVFALLGAENSVNYIIEKLCDYGMGDVLLYVGENLSYENEKITVDTAQNLRKNVFDSLSCVLILNNNASKKIRLGINDDEFTRIPKVPMTKAEVRAVTMSKLELTHDAIVYDVGAGTGSVSVEIALNVTEGAVYAVEKNIDAIEAIHSNKVEFKVDNLQIIEGLAPQMLENLPVPSHAFIGGSSGNLQEIVDAILQKNHKTKFVLNTVTLETLAEVTTIIKSFEYSEVVEISVSKAKKLANYNLMTANNPVFIISFYNYG